MPVLPAWLTTAVEPAEEVLTDDITLDATVAPSETLLAMQSSALPVTILGLGAVALLPDMSASGSLLTGLGFAGWSWLWALAIPLVAAGVAYAATRRAAMASLRDAA